jgi:hypothetical protein
MVASEDPLLSLLFQFWVVQSPVHASLMKKFEVANAAVALISLEMAAGGFAAMAIFLQS